MISTPTRRALAVAALGAAAAPLAACVGPPANEWLSSEDAICPIDTAETEGEVRFGFLGGPGTELYARELALLEACLPNAEVEWIQFPTGQDMIQAFAAGSVDAGVLGSVPTAVALSEPLELDVAPIAVNAVIGDTEALVAKDADSIEDLKGGTIAVPFSSTAHFSLQQALIEAGLDPARDVELINASPDTIPSAWNSAEVVASYVWDPVLGELQKDGTTLVTSKDVAEFGTPTYNITVADGEWARSNPEAVATYLELHDWILGQAESDPDDFIEANARQANISVDEAETQLEGQDFVRLAGQADALDELGEALHATAEFLAEQGEIDRASDKDRYADAIVEPEEG